MYWPPESGNIEPSSAKATQPNSEIMPPSTQTPRNRIGCGSGPAMSFAVRKIDEPMMPLARSRTESSSVSPRIRVGSASDFVDGGDATGIPIDQPMPNSSADSSGVPQRRQMTAEQSPQVSGSRTSAAHFGSKSRSGSCSAGGL